MFIEILNETADQSCSETEKDLLLVFFCSFEATKLRTVARTSGCCLCMLLLHTQANVLSNTRSYASVWPQIECVKQRRCIVVCLGRLNQAHCAVEYGIQTKRERSCGVRTIERVSVCCVWLFCIDELSCAGVRYLRE